VGFRPRSWIFFADQIRGNSVGPPIAHWLVFMVLRDIFAPNRFLDKRLGDYLLNVNLLSGDSASAGP
jgi:hypothetical protein